MKNEPHRLELTGKPLVRALVRVGRNEAPPTRLLERTFASLGVAAPAAALIAASATTQAAAGALGAGVPTIGTGTTCVAGAGLTGAALPGAGLSGAGLSGAGTGVAAASSSGVGSVGYGLLAKWVAVGAVTAAAVSGGAVGTRVLSQRSSSEDNVTAAARTAPTSVPRRGVRAPAAASAPVPAAEPTAHPLNPPAAVSAFPEHDARGGSSDLEREVKVIGAAHSALQAGDARRALALLADHEHGAQSGPLRVEAMFLRMEALADLGDYPAAQNAARRLLSAYPDGPHAARARAIVGMDNP